MSEPARAQDEDAREDDRWLGLPRVEWYFRGAGLACVAAGMGIRFVADGGVGLAGWGLAMLGAAIALFGGAPAVDDTGDSPERDRPEGYRESAKPPDDDAGDAPDDEPRSATTPRLILAAGSGLIFLIGVGWVIADVREVTRASNAWWVVSAGVAGLLAAAVWDAVARHRAVPLRAHPPRTTTGRALVIAGVVIALLVQLAIPLRYYLGDDRFDERFAWRMFSAVRVYRCDLAAYDVNEGRQSQVNLGRTIHVAWITTMRRSREGVLQRYLSWRCETADVDGARVVNRCVTPEGDQVPDVVRQIDCDDGAITAVEVR